jgi:hypothetical protein
VDKDFLPYELALELKHLGFDEPCFGFYGGPKTKHAGLIWYEMPNRGQETIPVGDVLAPLYQQAFRWFREKHGLVHRIDRDGGWWICVILNLNLYDEADQGVIERFIVCYPNTYEEAELACLIQLIEIVKNK